MVRAVMCEGGNRLFLRVSSRTMGKLLLLVLLGVLLYLVLKKAQRSVAPPPAGSPPAPKSMIMCAYCRVHVPLDESVEDGDRRYCCEEHRRLGRG